MKVLLSAFSCKPGFGSEPGVGWSVVGQIASRHLVWVLTDAHNRQCVEPELVRRPMPNVQFVFLHPLNLPLPAWIRRTFAHLYYLLWQVTAFVVARRLNSAIQFNLVHHVTYVNSWMPSLMGWLGVPFIWSAGVKNRTPLAFLGHMSWRSRLSELVRNAVIALAAPLAEVCTASRARFILSGGERRTWKEGLPVVNFPLGGLESEEIVRLARIPQRLDGTFRVASIGRLTGLKGFSLAILAFARFHREHPNTEYWIIGEGPERPALLELAKGHGCEKAVIFRGALERENVFEELSQIDMLLHPSLHEQFGYAVLEAMAAGRPVVCLRVSAARQVVSDQGGFLIAPGSPDQVVGDIYRAVKHMFLHPCDRRRMGEEARRWGTTQWAWSQAGNRLLSLYEDAVKVPRQLPART